jgi:isopenicillin N synthase-like dioxygenase
MSIETVDFYAASAPKVFATSLRETGFAIIDNHPVDQSLIDEAYELWQTYFSYGDKEALLFNPKDHDGFVPFDLSETAKGHEVQDLKEFFHYYPWGRCPAALKTITQELYQQMSTIAETLLRWVEAHTPQEIKDKLSMHLSEMIKDSHHTLFRLIHYPPLTGVEQPGAIRAAAHEDIDLLTVLPAATADGLQVLSSEGEWLDVAADSSKLVINTGDMLHECTNGFYRATKHRVVNPLGAAAGKARLSMPLFFHPASHVQLSDRHTAESYRRERFAELGLAETEAET